MADFGAPLSGRLARRPIRIGASIGYTGRVNFGPSPPVTHTNDVVAARISAMSNGSRTDNAESMRSADRIGDAELVESSSKTNDSQKEGPSAKAIASDKSFLVADAEKQNAAIQDKETKQEGTGKKSANKTAAHLKR